MIVKAAAEQAEAKLRIQPPEPPRPAHASPVWDDNSEKIEALRKEMVKGKLTK